MSKAGNDFHNPFSTDYPNGSSHPIATQTCRRMCHQSFKLPPTFGGDPDGATKRVGGVPTWVLGGAEMGGGEACEPCHWGL
eukprot:4459260-Pyramimonas_sp.AAC.1